MDDQELHKLIERLHQEIQNTHDLDPEGQELLAHLDADIRGLLGQAREDAGQARQSVIRRMQEGLNYFEVTHPALTTLLNNFLESLSNAGI